MADFTLHDTETAPEASQPFLANSLASFGMIPGLHAVMAESPELLEAYQTLHALFLRSSLTDEEKTVVWQTINVEHNCHYCVPAHTGVAKAMKVDDAISDALRNETPLPSERLETLRDFTLKVVRDRGHVDAATVDEFIAAGFTRQNILDILLGLSQKVMSNYTNHIAQTPVDSAFKRFDWQKVS